MLTCVLKVYDNHNVVPCDIVYYVHSFVIYKLGCSFTFGADEILFILQILVFAFALITLRTRRTAVMGFLCLKIRVWRKAKVGFGSLHHSVILETTNKYRKYYIII